MATAHTYDVLMATDLRFPGGSTSSVVEEIRAQARAGYRTGLLHLPSPTLWRARPFAPKIREVLDRGEADLVVGASSVEAKLVLARHPSVFTDPPAELPKLSADQVIVAVNNVVSDARLKTKYYDVSHVQQTIKRMVGVTATWAPIGPRIRDDLAPYADVVPLLPTDWENVIDLAEWQVERDGFVSDRPVIGRHSRAHWSKWPDDKHALLAAYPDDPRYEVHVLGGTESPVKTLGRLPQNWVDYPFGSLPAPEFLAGIDFLVYFHHPGLIEAFGRVVLEGLAAGAVAIVPHYMEPLFGDACQYAAPADVRDLVDRYYDDWDAYLERSRAGVDLVRRRFSHGTHIARIRRLIGEPSGEPSSPVIPSAEPRGVLVVDLSRTDDTSEAAVVVSSVARTCTEGGGRCVVAAPAARTAALDSSAAVETFPRVLDELPVPDRQVYLERRLAGLIHAHRPAAIVVIDDGGAGFDDALRAVGAGSDLWRIRPGGSSTTDHGDLSDRIAGGLPPGWTITRIAPDVPDRTRPSRPSTRRRVIRAVRHRSRGVVVASRRQMLQRLKTGAGAAGLMLFEVDEASPVLPVRAGSTHPEPAHLPVTLVVVTGDSHDPDAAVRAIAQRQLVTGTFRAALLAPASWEPAASRAGLAVETLLPESTWRPLHGSGWDRYVRQRVDEACRAFGPATIVHTDGAFGEAGLPPVVLDILESAHVRRRMGGEA